MSRPFWKKLGGNSKKIQDNIDKFGGRKFWRRGEGGKSTWRGTAGSDPQTQPTIYLFIYLFIGNKPHSTIYTFIPNKFIYLFKQKFCSLVTVDPVISNYHHEPDFPHHCLQYKSMSQIIPVGTLYFWMTLQQAYNM